MTSRYNARRKNTYRPTYSRKRDAVAHTNKNPDNSVGTALFGFSAFRFGNIKTDGKTSVGFSCKPLLCGMILAVLRDQQSSLTGDLPSKGISPTMAFTTSRSTTGFGA